MFRARWSSASKVISALKGRSVKDRLEQETAILAENRTEQENQAMEESTRSPSPSKVMMRSRHGSTSKVRSTENQHEQESDPLSEIVTEEENRPRKHWRIATCCRRHVPKSSTSKVRSAVDQPEKESEALSEIVTEEENQAKEALEDGRTMPPPRAKVMMKARRSSASKVRLTEGWHEQEIEPFSDNVTGPENQFTKALEDSSTLPSSHSKVMIKSRWSSASNVRSMEGWHEQEIEPLFDIVTGQENQFKEALEDSSTLPLPHSKARLSSASKVRSTEDRLKLELGPLSEIGTELENQPRQALEDNSTLPPPCSKEIQWSIGNRCIFELGRLLFAANFTSLAYEKYLYVSNKIDFPDYMKQKHPVNMNYETMAATTGVLDFVASLAFMTGDYLSFGSVLWAIMFDLYVRYDFHNYEVGSLLYETLLDGFMKFVALFGALLIYIGMQKDLRLMEKSLPIDFIHIMMCVFYCGFIVFLDDRCNDPDF